MNFPCVRLFVIIYKVFYTWSNFIKILFYRQYFIFITVTFVFNIIIVPKIIYSYCFIIAFFFFFILKKVLNASKYYIFNSFNFFCYSNKISYVFNGSMILFFFCVLNYFLFFECWIFHYFILWKKKLFKKQNFVILFKKEFENIIYKIVKAVFNHY